MTNLKLPLQSVCTFQGFKNCFYLHKEAYKKKKVFKTVSVKKNAKGFTYNFY